MNFLKNVYAHDLEGYDGDNIHYILDTLRNKHLQEKANNHSSAHPTAAATAADPWHYAMSQPGVYGQQASSRKLLRRRQSEGFPRNSMRLRTVVYKGEETLEEDDVGVMRVLMRNGPTVNRDDRVINKHTMQRTTSYLLVTAILHGAIINFSSSPFLVPLIAVLLSPPR